MMSSFSSMKGERSAVGNTLDTRNTTSGESSMWKEDGDLKTNQKYQNNLLITLLFHSLSLFSEWYGGRRKTKKKKTPPQKKKKKKSFCQWYDVWVAPRRQPK